MTSPRSIVVYCVPQCGHARAVLALLRRRHVPFVQRSMTPEAADEVISAYHLYTSPVMVINGEIVSGTARILARVETLAAAH